MERVKTFANMVRNRLDEKDIRRWHQHTRFTKLTGLVVRELRQSIQPELCTGAWYETRLSIQHRHTHAHTCSHIRKCTRIYKHTHEHRTSTCTNTRPFIHRFTYTSERRTRTRMRTHKHMPKSTLEHARMHACMYACIHLYLCTYANASTHIHTHSKNADKYNIMHIHAQTTHINTHMYTPLCLHYSHSYCQGQNV